MDRIYPPKAPSITITQGGVFQKRASKIEEMQNKIYSVHNRACPNRIVKAANKIPTTAALTPSSAPCMKDILLTLSQNGKTPITSKKAGRKIAIVASIAQAFRLTLLLYKKRM